MVPLFLIVLNLHSDWYSHLLKSICELCRKVLGSTNMGMAVNVHAIWNIWFIVFKVFFFYFLSKTLWSSIGKHWDFRIKVFKYTLTVLITFFFMWMTDTLSGNCNLQNEMDRYFFHWFWLIASVFDWYQNICIVHLEQ